jgi:hypothetical protein
MQGLNYKGLKRNWAETKEKGLNRKVLSQREDIFVNAGKLRGFSAKTSGPAGVDLVDLGWPDLDPLDLDPKAVAACGWRGRRDASDLNPTAQDVRRRRGRRGAQADGGGRRW